MAISVSEIEEDDNYLTFSEETLKNRIFDDIDFYSDVIAEYGDVTSLRISESYAVQNSGKDTFITFIFDNSSCIGYLTVYNQLNSNNNPPIFSVYSSEDEVSHAILCKAVKGYSTGIKFGFMDPNYSTTTYTGMISQPSDPSKFVYTTPSGRVYDVWKYYRYSII